LLLAARPRQASRQGGTNGLIGMPPLPRVSVVIPCRDQAHYLGAALASVAAQSAGPTERIVVDDGSRDDTAGVANAAGATLIRQPPSGLSAARNRGLMAARGEFVIFLDADDELEPDAVETGVAMLEQHPSAWMVGRRCALIDAHGARLPTFYPAPASDLYGEWLMRNLVWTPGAVVFRRPPLVQLGGFPADDVGPAADYAVYLEMARKGRALLDPRTAVRYRQHDRNMSRDGSRMLRATLAVLRREAPHVPPAYRWHYREGLRLWRTFYGEQIVQQLRVDTRRGRVGADQLKALGLLLRECRGLVWRHATRKLRRVAAGHPPAAIESSRFINPSAPGDGRAGAEPAETRR
jgi:glycosyltransferase involved in cell wall biosynthesis